MEISFLFIAITYTIRAKNHVLMFVCFVISWILVNHSIVNNHPCACTISLLFNPSLQWFYVCYYQFNHHHHYSGHYHQNHHFHCLRIGLGGTLTFISNAHIIPNFCTYCNTSALL